jgi:hypothetical protein
MFLKKINSWLNRLLIENSNIIIHISILSLRSTTPSINQYFVYRLFIIDNVTR